MKIPGKKPLLALTAAALIITAIYPSCLLAGEYLGLGAHFGFHPNAGNLSNINAEVDPQNSYIAGVILKLDLGPFFLKTGGDFVFLSTNGDFSNIADNQHVIKEINSKYSLFPLCVGLNFSIKEKGKLYIGAGASYIMGYGEIKHVSDIDTGAVKKTKIDEKLFGRGLLTGVQMQVSENLQIFMDWEYVSAKSDPVIDATGAYTGLSAKSFALDYSGNRFHFGFMYYAL